MMKYLVNPCMILVIICALMRWIPGCLLSYLIFATGQGVFIYFIFHFYKILLLFLFEKQAIVFIAQESDIRKCLIFYEALFIEM